MTPSINHYEHRSGRSRSGGFPNVRQRCAHTHARGEHGRVDYDPEFNGWAVSPPASRRCVTNLPETGRAIGLGAFSRIHVLAPLSLPDSVEPWRGRVLSSPRHARRIPLSRCRSVDLRYELIDLTLGRRGHIRQDLANAPHHHNCVLSQPNFRAPKHGRSSKGWRYQKTIMRCPK